MAAKAKAPAQTRKATAAKTARPKGLQLSAAQFKAYNAAFAATASRLRQQALLNSSATGLRKYRLNAAYASLKKLAVARSLVRRNAVAAYAMRQTWNQSRLGHQNAALQSRVEQRMYHQATLLGRAQFARAGEAKYAHAAVMRTVTQAQAVNFQRAFYGKVSKIAKKAGRSTKPGKATPLSKSITATANQAGLKAAKAVKPSKTRTAPAVYGPWGMMMGQPPKTGPIEWVGDEFTPNCVIVAVANHVQKMRSVTITPRLLQELTDACPAEPLIEQVLYTCWEIGWPYKVHLTGYTERIGEDGAFASQLAENLVIGYRTECGDHAALLLKGGRVVSWGAEQDFDPETVVEEAWEIRWDT
jgi:hypothetical protein